MLLGISQQVVLVPVFLHFWTSDILAAWLAIYAAGNLILVADAGLQLRAINRFLAFKASVDCDGRTGRFYAAMLRIYLALVAGVAVLVTAGVWLLPPSAMLGFRATPHFDAAFLVVTLGVLLLLPSNLTSGLYRARGNYGRSVWLQCGAMLVAQIAQMLAVFATGSLLAVAIAYMAAQVLMAVYLVAVDGPILFPFLRGRQGRVSWRWGLGQIRLGFPFAVAGATEIALVNAPILLVSAFVSERVAVAQWALTRVIAGLVRMLCTQITLPLAAELGHDFAIGDKERLRHLYARGSAFVALVASLTVSGLLPFWPDFFTLWTRGSIPYDPVLAIALLVGAAAAAPSILALGFASYSNRGDLLVRTKGLQLAVFLMLAVILIPPMGPLGAAVAIVASDLLVQCGLLALTIIGQTLREPLRHVAWLAALSAIVVASGWGTGAVIRFLVPLTGIRHFLAESALWLVMVGMVAALLSVSRLRDRLVAAVPR